MKRLPALLRWGGRILLAGLILLLVCIAFLLVREALTRKKYRAEYPPPGNMVDIGTHELHWYCQGTGSPTVLFESDIDQFGMLSWDSVQGEVAQFTRACSYDRAGILWSEPGPRPRDGETIAAELAALLEAAGEQAPYVLVGHAFGGAYVRIYAGKRPGDVCGMVLLDSAHPDELARFAEFGLEKEIPQKEIRPLILVLSHLGMPGRFKGPQYSLKPEIYLREQAFIPQSSMAWFDEMVAAPASLEQAAQVENLGELPLVVLASARPSSLVSQTGGQNFQEIWLELQAELTALSKNSELKPLAEAGHYIQYDQPEVVIDAIRGVVQQCSPTRVP